MSDSDVTRRGFASLTLGSVAGLVMAGAEAAEGKPASRAVSNMSGAASAIAYSKMKLYTVRDSDLDSAPSFEFPFVKGSLFKAVNTGIDEPAAQINFEDFNPGPDIVWSMFHDEVQYVTSGRAQITFHLPPLMAETGSVVAEPGSIYLLPRGARIVWHVLGDAPFRHLCVCIPNPGYPLSVARSVQKS